MHAWDLCMHGTSQRGNGNTMPMGHGADLEHDCAFGASHPTLGGPPGAVPAYFPPACERGKTGMQGSACGGRHAGNKRCSSRVIGKNEGPPPPVWDIRMLPACESRPVDWLCLLSSDTTEPDLSSACAPPAYEARGGFSFGISTRFQPALGQSDCSKNVAPLSGSTF